MPGSELLSLLWMLLCVAAIIGLAYWFTKSVVGRAGLGLGRAAPGGRIQVLARVTLGKDQQLLLVRAAERYFLLGATAAGIATLVEFTAEEAAAWRDEDNAPPEGPPSFKEALQKVVEQRKKR